MKNYLKLTVTVALIAIFAVAIKKDYGKFQEFLKANPISHNLQAQREKVKNKAMMITINHYRPDLAMWKDYVTDGKPLDKGFLKESAQYYETITGYVPQVAEAHHLLALCQYFLGEKESAIRSLQKATVLEPRFFWSWYDLGVMSYREGHFAQSAQDFANALRTSPQAVPLIINASKIYQEVVRESGTVAILTTEHLRQGYRDAARMMDASVRRLRGQPAGIADEEVRLKVF